MAKFITIGERIHCISPAIREAMATRNPEAILKRAKEQLEAGATYLDVNIGPAENDGEDLMKWAVQLLQENFDNVPLALDTANKKAIEAGISVYNRAKGKPIVNSADAGDRMGYIDLAAANDAIVIALCSNGPIAADNDERMVHCQTMLEHGMMLGMEPTDLWLSLIHIQMCIRDSFIASKKFMKAEGGIERIVWMPKELKETVAERLNATAKELYGIDNFTDMVGDETIAEDPETLVAFLTEKNHPALSMDPMM